MQRSSTISAAPCAHAACASHAQHHRHTPVACQIEFWSRLTPTWAPAWLHAHGTASAVCDAAKQIEFWSGLTQTGTLARPHAQDSAGRARRAHARSSGVGERIPYLYPILGARLVVQAVPAGRGEQHGGHLALGRERVQLLHRVRMRRAQALVAHAPAAQQHEQRALGAIPNKLHRVLAVLDQEGLCARRAALGAHAPPLALAERRSVSVCDREGRLLACPQVGMSTGDSQLGGVRSVLHSSRSIKLRASSGAPVC